MAEGRAAPPPRDLWPDIRELQLSWQGIYLIISAGAPITGAHRRLTLTARILCVIRHLDG